MKLHFALNIHPSLAHTVDKNNKNVGGDGPLSTQCRFYVHTPRDIRRRRISIVTFTSVHLYGTINRTSLWLQSA